MVGFEELAKKSEVKSTIEAVDYITLAFCAGLGLVVSALLINLTRKFAASKAQFRGGQFHQTHTLPIPRLGGIGLAGAFVVCALAATLLAPGNPLRKSENLILIISALFMFAVGLLDDLRPIGAKRKLLFHILIASAVYAFGVRIDILKNPLTGQVYELGMFGFAVTVFWLVAFTNLMNLIDGIDGLAGGIGLMLMILLASFGIGAAAFSAFLAIGVAGALIAFLWFNFPPAKIYMGDGGAYFLGFLIGMLTIQTSHKGTIAAALIAPVFALALPIIDTTTSILRRGVMGLPIFRADQGHIHHRLARLGFSRRRTVLMLYSISLVFLILAFGVFWMEGRFLPIWIGVAGLAIIVPAHCWGFLPHPKHMSALVRDSSQLRKESCYALALGRWFELEAERAGSIDELWVTYQFAARKLGFAQVKLLLEDHGEVWRIHDDLKTDGFHHHRHEMLGGQPITIELAAQPGMSRTTFDHLSELAAEMWLKGASRWRESHGEPIRWQASLARRSHKTQLGRVVDHRPMPREAGLPTGARSDGGSSLG